MENEEYFNFIIEVFHHHRAGFRIYHNNKWGTVCDDSFQLINIGVTDRLNYSYFYWTLSMPDTANAVLTVRISLNGELGTVCDYSFQTVHVGVLRNDNNKASSKSEDHCWSKTYYNNTSREINKDRPAWKSFKTLWSDVLGRFYEEKSKQYLGENPSVVSEILLNLVRRILLVYVTVNMISVMDENTSYTAADEYLILITFVTEEFVLLFSMDLLKIDDMDEETMEDAEEALSRMSEDIVE
ncbi:hypothetical protein MAR_006441 [Mya arenaria]|uniref:Uncharacterized protein n=1 Tax=Mya arenaria TaxID=6604 RepID=A0ABY7DC74_MYAAR|nr:hypothetical protein MAR_006441 [Mya arenaria]